MADHLHRVSEVIDNLDVLLSTAFDAYLARISVQQNEDMRKISAGAALVVVPTLIAGIYGMNFDHMPELHWTYGYPFAIALMVSVSGGPAVVLQEVRMALSGPATSRPSAWRVVWWFGFVSLAADMVYEGARSMYGPVLAALGASAVLVGAVTGAGDAMALVLRLVFGPVADRTGRYWTLTIVGYGLTAVCVPLLFLAPRLGSAGLAFAVTMILLERLGKAVRSPSKSALLAHVAGAVGRGRGFGVHKALDQVGAFAGPLLVAAVVAAASLWAGMAVLAVPGAITMVLLLTLRRRVPDPSVYDPSAPDRRRIRPRPAAGGPRRSAPACRATSSATPSRPRSPPEPW